MIDPSDLLGRWLHSHEEDEGHARVYRPEDYPFPPARGREGFELRPDGEFVDLSITPTDQIRRTPGEWSREGDRISVRLSDGSEFALAVVEADDDLRIERPPD